MSKVVWTEANNVGKAVPGVNGGRGDEIKSKVNGDWAEVVDFSWTEANVTFRLSDGSRQRRRWDERIEVRRANTQ